MFKKALDLLIIDQDKKQISHTKFWANVGYLLMCIAFMHQVWMSTATTELYLVFGGLFLGNRTLNKLIQQKGVLYGQKEDRKDGGAA